MSKNSKPLLINIGVVIPARGTTYMEEIIKGGITNSGLDSRDVYFSYDNKPTSNGSDNKCTEKEEQMSDDEFDDFLKEHGIDPKEFKEW